MTIPMVAAIARTSTEPMRVESIARPEPRAGEVLVRIQASGINPLDIKIYAGAAAHARQPLPAILGLDLAGVVETLGPGVERFRPGDKVYGMTGGVGGHPGTLAQFAAVDADLLALKPANLSMREAAALPLIFITAWEGLVDRAAVGPKQSVLIQGGAGGIGHIRRATRQGKWRTGVRNRLGASAGQNRGHGRGLHRPCQRESVRLRRALHLGEGIRGDLRHSWRRDARCILRRRAALRKCRERLGLGHAFACAAVIPRRIVLRNFHAAAVAQPSRPGAPRRNFEPRSALGRGGKIRPHLDPRRFTLRTVGEAYDALTSRSAHGKLVVDVEMAAA